MQNYSTHSKIVPLYHYVLSIFILITTAINGYVFVNALLHKDSNVILLSFSWLCISISLILLFWFVRSFALRAQNRAIRAEENFRHFVLTGKPLDSKLGIGQIIALRFASDEEFPNLALKALSENLSNDSIKKAIINWRADNHRV